MTFIKKSAKRNVGEDVEKRESFCTIGGDEIGVPPVENSMELPQKIKNETVLWLSDSTSGNIAEETWNTNLKEYMHPDVLWCVT